MHLNRLRRAKGMHQKDMIKRYANTIPRVAIDHVVKERYPTFIDALRDMDDALTLCCLFATFPKLKSIPPNLIALCRRLTVEFMHVCIAARALRKVFISIKGIYFQVELKGQAITWVIPHNYPHEVRFGYFFNYNLCNNNNELSFSHKKSKRLIFILWPLLQIFTQLH